ncbi:MAG TPA: substrate-binding domain-containing protein [Flavobacterium sp.]|nr:substrate-binding domain-containing protein [Flavobacterium sp.]
MKTIRIAGVPEHFNLPWHLAIESKKFEAEGLHVEWTDVPEGTGKLCQMLRGGETDIAVILTEGIIKDIVAGNPSKIVQLYVQSPLIWGIHVAAASRYESLCGLENKKAAISRIGSGSQLMAYVNARSQGWKTEDLEFEAVGTIEGAVKALAEGTADYYMWERFMTKPLVDQGIFRRIADCPTPWPCFVIAARNEFLDSHPEEIAALLDAINGVTASFKEIPDIGRMLSLRYGQKIEDATEWLSLTEWSQRQLDAETLNNIQNQLLALSIIDKKGTFAAIAKS